MDQKKIYAEYGEKFGNFQDIFLPQFMDDQRFTDLLKTALDRGKALTQEEVATAIPDAAWDW